MLIKIDTNFAKLWNAGTFFGKISFCDQWKIKSLEHAKAVVKFTCMEGYLREETELRGSKRLLYISRNCLCYGYTKMLILFQASSTTFVNDMFTARAY